MNAVVPPRISSWRARIMIWLARKFGPQFNLPTIAGNETAESPEEEQEELALIYQSKGLPGDRAREPASHMMADKGSILDTLAREELGIDPEELGGSAYEAAFTSFILFTVGAIFPHLPILFLERRNGNLHQPGSKRYWIVYHRSSDYVDDWP